MNCFGAGKGNQELTIKTDKMEPKKFTPTVTIALDRYDELIEAEKKSVKEYPHTVLIYNSLTCSNYVQTDDVAVVKLAEDLKSTIEKGQSYYLFYPTRKWKRELAKWIKSEDFDTIYYEAK